MFDVLQFLKLLNKSNIKFKEVPSSSKLLTTLGFDKQLSFGFVFIFSLESLRKMQDGLYKNEKN